MAGIEEPMEKLDLSKWKNVDFFKIKSWLHLMSIYHLAGAIFTSELHGSDETGDGSESKPFKTALKVSILSISRKHHTFRPIQIYVDNLERLFCFVSLNWF